MIASSHGNKEIIELLTKNKADVNATDNADMTALMFVSSEEIAELLINAGANVNVKSNIGRTVLMEASASGQIGIAELLKKHGAKE